MFNALHTWAKYQFWIHIRDLKIRSWGFWGNIFPQVWGALRRCILHYSPAEFRWNTATTDDFVLYITCDYGPYFRWFHWLCYFSWEIPQYWQNSATLIPCLCNKFKSCKLNVSLTILKINVFPTTLGTSLAMFNKLTNK